MFLVFIEIDILDLNLNTFLTIYLVASLLRFVYYYCVGHLYISNKSRLDNNYSPLVSAIIPAHNEEVGITKTIHSILDSDYRNLEIIIVDDGSTDKTYEVANQISELWSGKIVIIRSTSNRGKASALNTGILSSKGEIVVTIDADSYVKPESISELVKALSDSTYNEQPEI